MPLTTKQAKTKLGKLQWRNRKKILGNKKLKVKASNNADKYYNLLARHHNRIVNIRQDTIPHSAPKLSQAVITEGNFSK